MKKFKLLLSVIKQDIKDIESDINEADLQKIKSLSDQAIDDGIEYVKEHWSGINADFAILELNNLKTKI